MKGSMASMRSSGATAALAEGSLRLGDELLVQAGDFVPADLRLVEARGLAVDEWELTGEIAPVEKRLNGEGEMRLYRGSRVTRGSGKGVVLAIGAKTEYQDIVEQARERACRPFPPLVRARYLALLVLLAPPVAVYLYLNSPPAWTWVAVVVVAAALLLLQNDELIVQAAAARQVASLQRRGIQILDARALGLVPKVSVVCLDKTGVLTTRDIAVRRLRYAEDASGAPDSAVTHLSALACALGNDIFYAERLGEANPIDRALLAYAAQNGVDGAAAARQYRRIYDQPFDSENRYMVAGFESSDERLFVAKGDPDAVLALCSEYVSASGLTRRASADFLLATRAAVQAITQQGDIALALACQQGSDAAPPEPFTFLCLVQLENPLQPDAGAVVGALKAKGVRVVMLTGDKPETALAVGRETGIDRQARYSLTGKQIATMAISDVAQQSGYVSIFARLLPSQKGILVRALQQRHNWVAMVGDGANDVIALRAADVAISFAEHSSPFARRVAHILIDDLADLLTLVASAGRMQRAAQALIISRTLVLAAAVLASYGWMLSRLLWR